MLLVAVAALAVQAAPKAQDAPRVKPLNLQEWVTEDDYPLSALRYDEAGEVDFDLTIAGDGTVERCEIARSSNSEALDGATCSLISQRARFSTPKAGLHYRGRITWKIPPAPPQLVTPAHIAAIVRVSGDGKILGCEEKSEGKVPEAVQSPCKTFGAEVPLAMLDAIGAKGLPLALTMEYLQFFDGDPEAARFYSKPGQMLLGRRLVHFDVAQSGKVENCRDVPTGQEGILGRFPSPCLDAFGPYVPPLDAAGKPRAIAGTMEMAISRAL